MADAVTSQTLYDGERTAVLKFTNISDGTGESAVLKVDASTLSGAPTDLKIERIWYAVAGMVVNVLWDATTDVTALVLQGDGFMDLSCFGGLDNNSGSGKTGDIRFTTVGHTSGDSYSIIMELKKS